jgi:prevent-host-death family protein
MQIFSATDAKQAFGAALETAQRQPVMIQKQNRDVAVLMSVQEYNKLRGLRLAAFDRLADAIAAKAAARGLTEAEADALLAELS